MNKSVLKKIKDKAEYDVELEKCKIKIGGKDEDTCGRFVPNVNMSKWNDECWLNINRPLDVLDELETFDGNGLGLELGNEKSKYYIDDDGNLEYEIELKTKPFSNKIELELLFSEGLEFSLQPLIPPAGSIMPENVLGSYAVYWKEQNNEYETGKFCQIYRIKVIDKNGKWRWCKQAINGNLWAIELPQHFLDDAVYPITVDPVLGYNTIGSSTQRVYNSMRMGQVFTSPAVTGIATMYHAAISNVSYPYNQKFGIYDVDQATENPNGKDLVDGVEMPNPIISDDNQVAAQGGTILASTKYWVGTISKSGYNYVRCDFVGTSWIGSGTNYDAEWKAVFDNGQTFGGFRFSIWVDYEPAAEGAGKIFSEEGIHSRILR